MQESEKRTFLLRYSNSNSIDGGLLSLLTEDYYSYYGSDTIARQEGMGGNGGRVRSELSACLLRQAERRY